MELQQQIQARFGFDFIGNRNIAFVFSIVLIVLGIGSTIFKGGLSFGIDFAGGTLVEIQFNEPQEVENIRNAVAQANLGNSVIQPMGEENIVLIRVQGAAAASNSDDAGKDEGKKIVSALETVFGKGNFEVRRVEQVGPQVGSELRRSAQLALLFAIAGMVLYISWRFESKFALPVALIAVIIIGLSSWNIALSLIILLGLAAVLTACVIWKYHYAFAAIVALIHDVIITVGMFSITNREITLTVIAALLTIIGYSINDTIVVFDRIRENLHLMNRKDVKDILNTSINQTLSRTILTSLTTLLVVVVLFVAGGQVINDFAFALLIGITIGTYSSVFVATPLLFIWNERVKGGIFKKA